MASTKATSASGTFAIPTGTTVDVKAIKEASALENTLSPQQDNRGVFVRVKRNHEAIVIRIEPDVLAEQRRIEEMNERIAQSGSAYD